MKMRILGAAALLAAVSATPAYAQDVAGRFTGGHVEVIGGFDFSSQAIDPSERGISGIARDNFKDALYGASGGFDFSTPGGLVFGAEAEVARSSLEDCEMRRPGRPARPGGALCTLAGNQYYAGGRAGVVLQNAVLAYGKLGYARANMRGVAGAGDDRVTVDRIKLDGIRGGLGVEASPGGLLVKLEYRYTKYEEDFSSHQGVVGVGVRF